MAELTAPDGGEVWTGGSDHLVRWNMSDVDTPGMLNFTLEYSSDGGSSWMLFIIGTGPPPTGAYLWSIPAIDTEAALVRVCVSDGTDRTCDQSASTFTIDSTPPAVLSMSPTNDTTNVTVSADVVVAFSESMNRTSTEAAFAMSPDPGGIAYRWSATSGPDDTMAVSHNPLQPCTWYTASMQATARDDSMPGNALGQVATTTFRTSCAPQVVVREPSGGEVWSGGVDQTVVAELLDADESTLTVWANLSEDGGASWRPFYGPAPAAVGNRTLTAPLPALNTSHGRIRVTAQDSTSLEANATSPEFTIDSASPFVVNSTPSSGTEGVNVTTDLVVRFSEPMNTSASEAATSLDPPGGVLAFSWDGTGTVLTIAHDVLRVNMTYALTILVGAKDLSSPGNPLSSPHVLSFRTSPRPEVAAEAGPDLAATPGEPVTLDGSGSRGNIVNYTWEIESPGGPVLLYGESATFTFTGEGVFTVTLTVRDAAGNTASDIATVTVRWSPGSGLGLWIAVGLVAIVAALVTITIIRRRRRSRDGHREEQVTDRS